jgi:hypothetical protein
MHKLKLFLTLATITIAAGAFSQNSTRALVDLSAPQFTPPDLPSWVFVPVPDWVKPFQGVNGAPERYHPGKIGYYSEGTTGIDRYQANHFVWYLPETADFLYKEYTPVPLVYTPGTLPTYEVAAARYTKDCKTDTERGVALLLKGLPDIMRHPTVPPLVPFVRADRNFTDEQLLESRSGWCSEQARVFIRLCQVSGIQARMIHLFGQHHTTAEFYADGGWAFADVSYLFVAPGSDGKMISVAKCHDRAAGQRY